MSAIKVVSLDHHPSGIGAKAVTLEVHYESDEGEAIATILIRPPYGFGSLTEHYDLRPELLRLATALREAPFKAPW